MLGKKRKSPTWEPVGCCMVPEPENCPNAIFEFYNKSKSGTVCSVGLKSNVRKHLLFLKWNMEYKLQEKCSNKYRYISPDGSKTYYSLRTLCNDLIQSAEPGCHSSQQPPSQVETSPLLPQEDQTLKLKFQEKLPFTSMLTNHGFMQLPEEGPNYNLSSHPLTEEPVVREYLTNGQTCNLAEYALSEQLVGQNCNVRTSPLFPSPIVEPEVTMDLFNVNPQENLSPITQDDDFAIVTEGQNCNVRTSPLFPSPIVEPEVTMDIFNVNPQENLSPITHDDNFAIVTEGQNCNVPTSPLFSSPMVESQVREYTMCQLNSNPQEESLIETQHDELAIVPCGPLIERRPKSKSRNPVLARDFADIEPELYPESILEYYKVGSMAARDHKADDKLRDLRMKVKKQMCAVGWDIFYVNFRNRRELRYVSPITGKTFISLITACKGYLDEQEKYNQIPLLTNSQENNLKRPPTPHQDSSYSPLNPFEKRAQSPPPPVVASMGPPSSRLNSRNLLVKLIESNEVHVGMEVYYRGRDNLPMAEGHICADGMIMCNCCQESMNLNNFEVHAGSNNHRPAAYIFLKDGRSLQDCHLLWRSEEKQSKLILKRDKSNVKATLKNNKAKKCSCDQRWKRYKCSICNKWDALVLCYQCPSKFHTSCLGLSEVPNGEWFCKACEDEPVNESESCPEAIVEYFMDGNILTQADDKNKRLKDLRTKAKKDLLSRGWELIQVNGENKRELKFRSPSGKDYYSLDAACAAIIFGDGITSIV